MNTKLTLKLDKKAIDKAKRFAQKHQQSLSKMVELYFYAISKTRTENKISELTEELSGVIKLPDKFDYKREHGEHVFNKYSK